MSSVATEFKEIITLKNRYLSNHVFLVHIEDGMYKLYADGCYYLNVTWEDEDNNIAKTLDPDGGPLLMVGALLTDDYLITKIYWDSACNCWLVDLEHVKKTN